MKLARTYVEFCEKDDGVVGCQIGCHAVDAWMIFKNKPTLSTHLDKIHNESH